MKKLSFKLFRSAKANLNKSRLRKKFLRFTLSKESYYYYKKMFRWRRFVAIDSYKLLGLRFFNSLKEKYISRDSKVALKKRTFSRKKFNHNFLMDMQKFKLKNSRKLFSIYNFFFKNFPSNGLMLSLKSRKNCGKVGAGTSNYWNFFYNKKPYINYRNKGKWFSLKNKPLFFKLNHLLPKVIVKKNFSIFYKEGAKNLKKKMFFKKFSLSRNPPSKNTIY